MDPYEFAVQKVREAGAVLLDARDKGFAIAEKDNDPKNIVTTADTAVSEFLSAAIRESFPQHGIYSEEGGESDPATSDFVWVIDPIDGTSNFSRGIPHYAVCLGLVDAGIPVVGAVYNPVTNELFSFKKGGGAFMNGAPIKVRENAELSKASVFLHAGRKIEVRDWGGESYRRLLGAAWKTNNYGSSALDTCFVAAGRIEASIYGTLSLLDIAAAVGILKEAGGVIATKDGKQPELISEPQLLFAANNQTILDDLRTLLA